MEQDKCICGKNKDSMNLTIWKRHINSCKINKLKRGAEGTKSLKSFFIAPRVPIDDHNTLVFNTKEVRHVESKLFYIHIFQINDINF